MIHKEGTVMAFLGSFDISASGMSAQRVDVYKRQDLNTVLKMYFIIRNRFWTALRQNMVHFWHRSGKKKQRYRNWRTSWYLPRIRWMI